MPKLIQSRYLEGRSAYRDGKGISHIIGALDDIERQFHKLLDANGSRITEPDPTKQDEVQARREAIHTGEFGHDAGPSLIAGFADGVIADIRAIAGQRRGQTA